MRLTLCLEDIKPEFRVRCRKAANAVTFDMFSEKVQNAIRIVGKAKTQFGFGQGKFIEPPPESPVAKQSPVSGEHIPFDTDICPDGVYLGDIDDDDIPKSSSLKTSVGHTLIVEAEQNLDPGLLALAKASEDSFPDPPPAELTQTLGRNNTDDGGNPGNGLSFDGLSWR